MKRETRMPAAPSRSTNGARRSTAPAASSPPSVVSSLRRSGTRQAACGLCRSAISSIGSVAAISRLSGTVSSRARRAMSSSEMWRRSSRRWAVMPSAPAWAAMRAARTGSGCRPPRALRMVATWSMLTPRRSGRFSIMASPSTARAFHRIDHRRRTERGDDVGQVAHALHLDVHQQLEEILRAVGDLEVGDVAAALADHRREAAQAAGLVADGDGDAAEMDVFGVALLVPGAVEPAVRRVGEAVEGLAIDGVDGHTLARCYNTDDTVARQRVAAAGEMHRHAGNEAADRHRVSTFRLPYHAAGLERNHLGRAC